ncbi:hypothetical protein NE237_016704 [Protea cynaroides]|uniref:RING-type domain-containing protein n=1 Tax=Protea cynaroides TaxID=273540 RepID=A0A9Q0HHP1_9MAGN|nr:hypothetical protein NE237_016704 [Protea cynaroides]
MVSLFSSEEELMMEEKFVHIVEEALLILQQRTTRNKRERKKALLYDVESFLADCCKTSARKEELTKLIEKILMFSYEVLGFETASTLLPAFKKMKKIKVSSSDEVCVICQEEFKVEEEVMALSCCHTYHDKCIFRWLSSNGCCPICRFELVAPDTA